MSDFVNKTIGQLIKDTAARYPENMALFLRSSVYGKIIANFTKHAEMSPRD